MIEIFRTYVRDLKLSLLTGNYEIKYNISKRQSRFQFLKSNWKIIKYITKIGGVLTGSRALKCCSINDKYLFDRVADDFDFLVTKEMLVNICSKFNIEYTSNSKLTNKFVTICKGKVKIHLILKDELIEYYEDKGVRIATFIDIIKNKFYFIENGNLKDTEKHQDDLSTIFFKFNNL